jgi:hypothetical protein
VATTIDVLSDRIRSLCASAPFAFYEAVSSEDFARQPVGRGDQVYRVTTRGGLVVSGTAYTEERTDYADIEVIRAINAEYATTRRRLQRDANSLTAAIVRDGHQLSGVYTVPDTGRTQDIVGERGASFLTLRLTLPLNYEAQV